MSWADQAGLIGSAARYDLASGALSALAVTGYVGATCLANDLNTTSFSDARTPSAGDGFYYLVRSQNACGTGTYGAAGLDQQTTCP